MCYSASAADAALNAACIKAAYYKCLKQQSCSRISRSQSKETVNQAAVAAVVQPGQVLTDTKAASKGVDGRATVSEGFHGELLPTNMMRSFFGRSPLRKAPKSNF